jgi:hypothetical protein
VGREIHSLQSSSSPAAAAAQQQQQQLGPEKGMGAYSKNEPHKLKKTMTNLRTLFPQNVTQKARCLFLR